MFFTYVCLSGCKRFSLKGTKRIEIRPTSKTQMVLGSNGSGKSSLLRLGFTVLPPSTKDFIPGGYRHLKVSHNGHHYELRSSYDGKPEHSFIRDGEELNKGKTESVYRELVKEHFRMTQEIHNLLTGVERFTDMSPIRRRDWITQLSSTDFEYVLNFYNKVKKGQRDANAVVKHNLNRLTVETGKLRTDEEMRTLNERSRVLREELNELLVQSNPDLAQRLTEFSNEFEWQANNLLTDAVTGANHTMRVIGNETFDSIDEVHNRIRQWITEIGNTEGELKALGEEFEHIDVQMRKLSAIDGINPEQLRTERATLQQELEQLKGKLTTGLEPNEIAHTAKDWHGIESLIAMVHEVPSSPTETEDYSQENIARHRLRLDEIEPRISAANQKIWNIEGRLEHIGRCQAVDCPSCGSRFKPGIEEDDERKLNEALTQGKDYVNRHQAAMEESKEFLRAAEAHRNALQRLYRFRQDNPSLSGLWKAIDVSGGFTVPFRVIDICNRYRRDGNVVKTMEELEQRLRIIDESLSQVESLGGQSEGIRARYHQIEGRIQTCTQKLIEGKRQFDLLQNYLEDQKVLDAKETVINEKLVKLDELSKQITESFLQAELLQEVKKRQISLAMIEQTLTEAEIQQGIVNDIQKEIDTMSLQEEAYRLLMVTLSPTDGLIAEQIGVFINAVIDRMNAVINRTWGYNLTIGSCDVSKGELDYKFPLSAVKESNTVPDVALGSDSQVDIVNQAFRLVAYKFLHLDGYPLYLDELGRTFDEVHRHNLVPVIKELIEDDAFSQIFIISHFADGQGSYQNGQMIVLDDSHLTLKSTYNEHVVIEQ